MPKTPKRRSPTRSTGRVSSSAKPRPGTVVEAFVFEHGEHTVRVVPDKRLSASSRLTRSDGVWLLRVPYGRVFPDQARESARKLIVKALTREKADAAKSDEELMARAQKLAERYKLPLPASVAWTGSMKTRWADCQPATRSIRLTTPLKSMPDWVQDYVLVHELAHLVETNHSPAFWSLVNQYSKTERARGYLIAKSGDVEHD